MESNTVTYQVLARKWRPKSLAQLKGQEQVTRALTNALTTGQLHHAYLFTGTRGVGKTTLGRILAKCLNCQQAISPTPCEQCPSCLAINEGRFPDLIEVDAASRTKVEDTRELLENVQYSPTQGRFKIYLIDEVHMLSGHSFNALLKTLEEPPAHVKFILATTDPERIPATVLSRCLKFNLKALTQTELVDGLAGILQAENITYEPPALTQIARCANGSMRDALSLLEQAIAYGNGLLKRCDVEVMLGLGYERLLPELVKILAEQKPAECLQIVAQMAEQGANFTQLLASLLQVFHALALAQVLPRVEEISGFWQIDQQLLLQLKEIFHPEEIQLLYQIGLMGQRDLPFAPDARTGFEMILLRMMIFRPEQASKQNPSLGLSHEPQSCRLTEGRITSIKAKGQEGAVSIPESVPPVAQKQAQAPASTGEKAPVLTSQALPLPTNKLEKSVAGEENSATQKASLEPNLTQNWPQLISQLPLTGLTQMLLKHCVIADWNGQKMVLTLDPAQKACLSAARQEQIQQALQAHFGRAIKLIIEIGKAPLMQTPMAQLNQMKIEQQQKAHEMVAQDKIVQNLMTTFDATIEKIEILDEN